MNVSLASLLEAGQNKGLPVDLETVRWLAQSFHRSDGAFILPQRVIDFIAAYLSGGRPARILDPFAGIGELAIGVALLVGAKHVTAISRNEEQIKIGQRLDTTGLVDWRQSSPISELDRIADSFDAIVSNLPWGGVREELTLTVGGEQVRIKDEFGTIAMLKALLKLSAEGVGLFVVAPSFANSDRSSGVFSNLGRLGFALDACFDLPSGIFAPMSAIGGALVIIRKASQQEVFVAALPESREQTDVVLKNLRARRAGKDVALGRLVMLADVRGYTALVTKERMERMTARTGLSPVNLAEVVATIKATKAAEPPGFEDVENAVYLPNVGRSNAFASLTQLRLKPHNHFQLVVKPELADARYLAGFFNTPLGMDARESCFRGATIQHLTLSSLREMVVYLPDLNTQRKTVEADLHMEMLAGELNELREKLWASPRKLKETVSNLHRVNHEDRFTDWLDTLPFPLASILWGYHAAAGNEWKQYEHIDHFFEALAEFLATLHLSACTNDAGMLEEQHRHITKELSENRLSLEKSTFGTWLTICGVLMKKARTMLNGKEEEKQQIFSLFRTNDSQVLAALCDPRLVTILQTTNKRRNDWRGHGGATSEEVIRERRLFFAERLEEVRSVFGTIWERYVLIRPGALPFKPNGLFIGSVQRITGTRTPFAANETESSEPLVEGQLYFKSPDERRSLKLLPLIKVMASPRAAQNACYFYNRRDQDGVRFVSYHFEEEAEVRESFQDTAEVLQGMLQGLQSR